VDILLRTREHLTDGEVEKLIEAAGDNRHSHRDASMVLMPTGMASVPPKL
jgi:hypothetical protein